MKTILGALALLLTSTAANAASFSFDFQFNTNTFPGAQPSDLPNLWAGSGLLEFDERTTAQAATTTPTRSTYNLPFTLTLTGASYSLDLSTAQGFAIVSLDSPDANYDVINFFRGPGLTGPWMTMSGYHSNLSNTNLTGANFLATANPFVNQTYSAILNLNDDTYRIATLSNFEEVAAPVPEPGEWAMIAAGLTIVGGVARRRRKG